MSAAPYRNYLSTHTTTVRFGDQDNVRSTLGLADGNQRAVVTHPHLITALYETGVLMVTVLIL